VDKRNWEEAIDCSHNIECDKSIHRLNVSISQIAGRQGRGAQGRVGEVSGGRGREDQGRGGGGVEIIAGR